MSYQTDQCYLTGEYFNGSVKFNPTSNFTIEYEFKPVGKVKISLAMAIELTSKKEFIHPILAGICRNYFENNQDSPTITPEFFRSTYKDIDYPKNLDAKYLYFLKYVDNKGEKGLKPLSFSEDKDYTICYSKDGAEFCNILENLRDNKGWIKYTDKKLTSRNRSFIELKLTEEGTKKVEELKPKIPMIGLVDQKISTGNPEDDEKINSAKDKFFKNPESKENKRSACETLIFILEPLRKDNFLKEYFDSDTEHFFNIVNSFDIRHNKKDTKKIQHIEQLEWVFYSLLNTISTYTKLKKRLEK
jgi:hypothetical protein